MKQFVQDCGKANENWRRACYHEIVQKHGISVGACVKVKVGGRWNEPEETKIGIIKSINWDTINVMSGMDKRSDFAHSPLTIEVLVGSDVLTVTNAQDLFNTIGKN